jgi:hypothetical protein
MGRLRWPRHQSKSVAGRMVEMSAWSSARFRQQRDMNRAGGANSGSCLGGLSHAEQYLANTGLRATADQLRVGMHNRAWSFAPLTVTACEAFRRSS